MTYRQLGKTLLFTPHPRTNETIPVLFLIYLSLIQGISRTWQYINSDFCSLLFSLFSVSHSVQQSLCSDFSSFGFYCEQSATTNSTCRTLHVAGNRHAQLPGNV